MEFPTDHAAVMLIIESESGRILDANKAAASFYGYTLDRLRSMSIYQINMYDQKDIALEMEKAVLEERNYFLFPHRLASGEVRTVEVYSSPIFLREIGKPVLLSVVHDIGGRNRESEDMDEYHRRLTALVEARAKDLYSTRLTAIGVTALSLALFIVAAFFVILFRSQRRYSSVLAAALDEKSELLKELQHRVKNTLNTVAAIIGIEMQRNENGAVAEAMDVLFHRVEALAILYQKLYESGQSREIDLVAYLRSIIDSLSVSLRGPYGDIVFSSSVSTLFLDPKSASNMGLIANELVTNAVKHGKKNSAAVSPAAVVVLERTDGMIRLSVTNQSDPLPEGFDVAKGTGFGLTVSREFARQMRGDLYLQQDKIGGTVTFGVHISPAMAADSAV